MGSGIVESKVAIVTGASSGIGEATARRLRKLGYTVYAAARRTDRMAPMQREGIRVAKVDVTDDESMKGLVAQVTAEAGRIDVLVKTPATAPTARSRTSHRRRPGGSSMSTSSAWPG
jgi:NADP-dependent 3-hydroxy acid dehydrogenase YdfG